MEEAPRDAERLAAVAADLVAALPFRRPRRSLAAAESLHRALGAPRVAPTVGVVGTNGKTSTTTFAERMLAADGRRVAAFVSPHLDSWDERLRIDGRPVAPGTLADALTDAGRAVDAQRAGRAHEAGRADGTRADLRFFDLLTVAAARVALDAGADVAVFEAGLGGRLDATALLRPDVLAVTRVALDHTELLGATREAIYREKVGAARAGTAIVVAPSSADLLATGAHPAGSTVEVVPEALVDAVRRRHPGAPAEAVENAALAAFALARLPGSARPADVAALAGSVDLDVAGRWEPGRVAGVETLTDAGHNPDAWARLAAALRGAPPRPRVAVFATTTERGVPEIVGALDALPPAEVVLTTPSGRRGADPDAIAAALGRRAVVVPDPLDAFDLALERARRDDAGLVVFGSVYLAAAFRRWATRRAADDDRA